MIDTRAVAQEVQDQLTAAVHKGHEQFRKGQEQIRKGRESATAAVRTGSQIAQAVKPSLPKLPSIQLRLPSLTELPSRDKLRESAHEFGSQMLARQRKLADHAQDLASHAIATQWKLSGKAVEAASPFIVDGVARLTQAAEMLVPGRRTEHSEPLERPVADRSAAATEAITATDKPAAHTATTAKPATHTPAADKPAAAKAARKPAAKPSSAKPATGTAARKSSAGTTGAAKAKDTAASKSRSTKK